MDALNPAGVKSKNILQLSILEHQKKEQEKKINSLDKVTIFNPYRVEKSFMDESLIIKPIISYCMAYAFGLALGAFLNVHSTDLVDYDLHRGARSRSKATMLEYMNKIKSQGKGFASFGFFFAAYDVVFEKLRKRTDRYNDFMAGGLTASTLALDSGMRFRGLFTTTMVGGTFCYVMDYFMGDLF